MSTNRIKKFSSKNIEIWPFQGQVKVKIGGRAHIWSYTFWSATGSFFVQFELFLYSVTQETESFRMSPYLYILDLKTKKLLATPIYGYGRGSVMGGHWGSEIPPKVRPMCMGFWSGNNPKMIIRKKFAWDPPLKICIGSTLVEGK